MFQMKTEPMNNIPLTEIELNTLLHDLKSDSTERKEALSDPSKISHAICAFANDMSNSGKPGIPFIGARDNGTCANLEITDWLTERVISLPIHTEFETEQLEYITKEVLNYI